MIPIVLLAAIVALAYANGANDVSKGVGTLVGSGLATYRRALTWGTLWTVAGALAGSAVAAGLIGTFGTGLLQADPSDANRFLLAVSAGAFGWVMVASRTGLPVSTTHALTGAIVGTGLAMGGAAGIRWPLLTTTVVVPLALSPAAAALLAYAVHAVTAGPLSAASRYCVCVERRPIALAPVRISGVSADAAAPPSAPGLVMGTGEQCADPMVTARVRMTDAVHWGTSAVLSFARGMNDNPKIVALGVGAAGVAGLSGLAIFVAGAAAMGMGSYLYGRRVTTTLAERVTDIDPLEGLSASAVASALVLLASFAALPVSTTHVATGAIVGAGLGGGSAAIRWRTLSGLVIAWLVTLPVAGVLAWLAWIVAGMFSA